MNECPAGAAGREKKGMITIMSKEVKVTPMDTVNNARTMP